MSIMFKFKKNQDLILKKTLFLITRYCVSLKRNNKTKKNKKAKKKTKYRMNVQATKRAHSCVNFQ